MLRVALDRHHVDGVRLVRVHVDREAEVGRQVAADLVPRLAGVVAAHHVPVLLHEQHGRARRVHGDPVHAVADLGVRVGDVLGGRPWLIGCQVCAAVVGAERARGRDGGEDPAGLGRIQHDRVQAHAARAGLPATARSRGRAAPGSSLPGLPAVGGPEQRGVLDPGVDGVRVVQRRLEVPDPRELPRVRRAVVPLMRAGLAVVAELVADRLPASARRRRSAGSAGRTSRCDCDAYSRSGSAGEPLTW